MTPERAHEIRGDVEQGSSADEELWSPRLRQTQVRYGLVSATELCYAEDNDAIEMYFFD